VGDIAAGLDVPANYLSKIMHQLARAGIVISARGPYGGFRLASAPEDVALADVVGAFDSLQNQKRCLLGRPQCSDANPCGAHEQWREVRAHITDFFRDTTVADVLKKPAARARRRS
jgi:Rrf2 family protein